MVVSEPLPGYLHAKTVARVAGIIDSFVRSLGLGTVCAADGGFVLARNPDTVRGPDVAFVSKARELQAGSADPYFPGAPDLAIEVISPGNRPNEILGKVSDYIAAGCLLVWVVDPVREEVQVFRSPFTPRRLAGDDILDGEDVLPGLSIRVVELFGS